MTDNTLLVLSAVGVPPYSARGLTQTLAPIAQAVSYARTVNGDYVNLSPSQMRKYSSTITCADQDPPASVWPGDTVTVDCVCELAVYGYSETVTETDPSDTEQIFERPHVPGSIRYDDDFAFYRPQLEMVVTAINTSTDEYGHIVNWTMTLEEV